MTQASAGKCKCWQWWAVYNYASLHLDSAEQRVLIIKSSSELIKKWWIPTTWWWRTIKDAAVDGAFCCFAVLNQAPIRKLINNTYLRLTQPLRSYYSVAFFFFFLACGCTNCFSSVVLVMERFLACQEAFEPTVRYAKYHFAGFFYACLTRIQLNSRISTGNSFFVTFVS